MATADADDLLAYEDVSDLFALIADQWELFEPFLAPKPRWDGTTNTLRDLRNRNAHCRRPHSDDLGRLEQTLRDLEPGASRFYVSYASSIPVSHASSIIVGRKSKDPLVEQWVDGKDASAQHLLDHALKNYDTRFSLSYSVRPWAPEPDVDQLSGAEGVLWHARWIVRGREVRPLELWRRIAQRPEVAERIIFLELHRFSVTATFSALESVGDVTDAITHVFSGILVTSSLDRGRSPDFTEDEKLWKRETERLPGRVQIDSALALAEPDGSVALNIFGAIP
jgi:hypothetical protein